MTKFDKYKRKYNLKTDEEALAIIKTQSPRFKEYWMAKGYSEEEAKLELRKRNPMCKDYWIAQGYSEEEATYQIRCKLKTCKEYWIARGYSEEEAIKKSKENGKKQCPATKEYWIARGYSEEEAIKKSKENGEHFNHAHKNFSRKQNRFCKEYWMAKGYSEEEAIKEAKLENRRTTRNIPKEVYQAASRLRISRISEERQIELNLANSKRMKAKNKTHSPIFKEYWIARGYSEEEAENQVFHTKYASQKNFEKSSKIELRFFNELKNYINDDSIDIQQQKWVRINNKNYCQDGRFNNIVIEFNGTNFHLDERFYDENSKNPKGISFLGIKAKDQEKIDAYLSKEYNIIVAWEYDYLNHKQELFEIIKQKILNESNKKRDYWDSASFFNKR